ncbi:MULTISPECIES: S9 family peptidase [Brevibacterium]|uniref:Oligopeptidase B. Serine peptidase. MEROPS family S09A n=1 Tax=Brevibacterium antiquum CNRZ 918 TaxID=1255637 RepID=A0A2H1KXG6_9MICO|nr:MULTISPECIES: S9 family peptidase [Brevibacterium]SMY03922.1 oligopeptidase B. Serine peptidase. MEROPS family S09A [Brevibacterium antiquum CNRZ 918]HCG54735.1 S9 family peptidase [Brevibacterium sp.]
MNDTTAPVAKKVPHERTHHGHTFVDDYEWMRDKESPDVIAHLEAENEWTHAQTTALAPLRESIFTEIKTRIKETDMSVPTRRGSYWYFSRTKAGLDYGISVRAPIADADDWTPPEVGDEPLPGEEVIFDSNIAAEGQEFFSLGSFSLTDDGRYLLVGVDNSGDERYTLRLRDLSTGEDLPDTVDGTFAGASIDPAGRFVFYTTVDDAWRPEKVWRHAVGTDSSDDVCIFHEPDERFFVGSGFSRSGKYMFVVTGSKTTTGFWSLESEDLEAAPQVVWPRIDGVEYSVEHAVIAGEDRFLITHNQERDDFDIIDVPVADPAGTGSEPVDAVDEPETIADPHSAGRSLLDDVEELRIEDVDAFADFIVISYRRSGFARVGIVELETRDQGAASPYGPLRELPFSRETGTLGFAGNPEFTQTSIRLLFTSMSTPAVIYQHSVTDGTDTVLKRQPVLGSVDLSNYDESLVWASAEDGTQIPISLVYRTDLVDTEPAPMVLYGYGSYEMSMDPFFSVSRLSLLDRGVVFAIAHVRGGGEMGRHWYDQGKTSAKKNTFTDFIAAGRHLVTEGWTSPEKLVATGGSAGGLLMGAVTNMAPDLFAGVSAHVAFVDALTSILMPELPLTVIEWEEWGDPLHDAHVYEYMRSYSPYENVAEVDHPKILAVTSLNDTRVLYVEPAKWVARLREVGADVLLKTEMVAGHGGASGRYDSWKETAFDFAWILDVLGRADVEIDA